MKMIGPKDSVANCSLDPDIVAAIDDDFNFDDPDNELDDDFVMQLAQRWRRGKQGRY